MSIEQLLLRCALGFAALVTLACGARTGLPQEAAEDVSLAVPRREAGAGGNAPSERPDAQEVEGEAGPALRDAGTDTRGTCILPPCERTVLIAENQQLVELNLKTFSKRVIGPLGTILTDLAVNSRGEVYGVGFETLYRVNDVDATVRAVQTLPAKMTALAFSPADILYAAADSRFYRISLPAIEVVEVAQFTEGFSSSGDMVWIRDTLYATAHGSDDIDSLFEVDLRDGTSKRIGTTGVHCIRGLVSFSTDLYGFTCNGEVLQFDVGNGSVRTLTKQAASFNGAAPSASACSNECVIPE